MNIFEDINIVRAYISISQAFAESPEAKAAQKPIHEALERVAAYAHSCAKAELIGDGMDKLEKIIKGDKLQ